MQVSWETDDKTFQFKRIHQLSLKSIKLSIICDAKTKQIVTGSVTLFGVDYNEIDIVKLKYAAAQIRLYIAAINIGSSYLLKYRYDKEKFLNLSEDLDVIMNLWQTYIKEKKQEFHNTYLKGN